MLPATHAGDLSTSSSINSQPTAAVYAGVRGQRSQVGMQLINQQLPASPECIYLFVC
jgi:hypothetical protein